MKQIIKIVRGVFLVSVFSLSMNTSSALATSYEGYGQAGFYGEYQQAPKASDGGLSAQEKVESGMANSGKIPEAGDSSSARYLVIALFPLLLVSLYFKQLNKEQQKL